MKIRKGIIMEIETNEIMKRLVGTNSVRHICCFSLVAICYPIKRSESQSNIHCYFVFMSINLTVRVFYVDAYTINLSIISTVQEV